MKWIIDNWSLLVIIVGVIAYFIITGKQGIIQALVYMTGRAEKELGSKTGQMKLRLVYNMFVEKYPVLSKIIPFKVFSNWVDIALAQLKNMIQENTNIKYYIQRKD